MTYRSDLPAVALSALLLLVTLAGCGDRAVAPSPKDTPDTSEAKPPPPKPGKWAVAAPMPEARFGVSATALDGIVYVTGGFTVEDDGPPPTELSAFDPATGAWRSVGRLLDSVKSPTLAALGGRVYAVGGYGVAPYEPAGTLQIYDPRTGTVVEGPPMPTPRSGAAVAVLDGRIHVIGGVTRYEEDIVGSYEVFDPVTNAWSRRGEAPLGIPYGAVAVGGKLYVASGLPVRLYAYDVITATWSQVSSGVSDGEWSHRTVAALDGKIYLFGGSQLPPTCCSGAVPQASVDRFDPETGKWEQVAPMPTARSYAAAAVAGDAVYVIGGSPTGPYLGVTSANERFTPE